jgi:hypothetical protein
MLGSQSILTSNGGYAVYFTIGSPLVSLSYGSQIVGSVAARLGWYFLSSNSLFVFVKMTNSGSSPQSGSLAIAVDINFDGSDYAPMATIGSKSGFRISSSRNEIRFICRSYPLVRDVSSFWIGSVSSLDENYWTQVSSGSVSGVDSAAALSWQAVSIPAHSYVTRGVIVKFGSDESYLPILNLTFSTISSPFRPSDEINATGTITNFRYFESVRLFCVIDDDLSTLQDTYVALNGTSYVVFSFTPLNFGISDINHQVSFYAANSYGDVSRPQTLLLSGVPVGETGGNSGDRGLVPEDLGDPSISVASSNDAGAIVDPVAGVTGFGLVVMIVVTLCIRAKRKASVQDEHSALSLTVI